MKKLIVCAAGILAIVLSAAVSFAAGMANFRNYSADMVVTTPQGSTTSKVYATATKQRMEMKAEGQDTIMISRFDKKMAWMCMKDQKMCMEMALNKQMDNVQSQLNDPDVKMKKDFVGNEKVEGHPCKKYHITMTRDGKKENSGYIWEATDLNEFPIRFQSEDKSSMITWKNVSFAAISDSMFEVPQGYQKMDMSNMGGMGGMGGKRKGKH